MPKSIRFTELIKKSGKPHVVTLWSSPQNDPEFMKAVKEHRVLTVKQENVGSKKDFGLLGFHEQRNASYFVFPKPLPDKPETRVVGINYELLDEPAVKERWSPAALPKATKPPRHSELKPLAKTAEKPVQAPVEKEFTATLHRVAVWTTKLSVTALNQKEAREKLQQLAKSTELDLNDATVKNRIEAVKGK